MVSHIGREDLIMIPSIDPIAFFILAGLLLSALAEIILLVALKILKRRDAKIRITE
jgi:hypothetical protein